MTVCMVASLLLHSNLSGTRCSCAGTANLMAALLLSGVPSQQVYARTRPWHAALLISLHAELLQQLQSRHASSPIALDQLH
jgi:hypothetical protein